MYHSIEDLKPVDWIAKSAFFLSLDQDDECGIILPDNVKIIPDILTCERLCDVISSMLFFGYNIIPKNIYEYIREVTVQDFDDVLKTFNQGSFEWNEVSKFKEFNQLNERKLCDWAAEHGNLNMLIWTQKHRYSWNENLTKLTAENGHLDCLIYLHKNGCPWSRISAYFAAKNGHLECLMYLRENRCPMGPDTVYKATMYGHLNCLIYLHKSGCPWDCDTIEWAARNGHLECLKYALEHGCPEKYSITISASRNGHLDCLRYAVEHGYHCSSYSTECAIEGGHLDCFIYLYERGYRPLFGNIRDMAKNHPLILDYLDQYGIF